MKNKKEPIEVAVQKVVKKVTTKVVKKEVSNLNEVLKKIEAMERTKLYYGKIKVKLNNLNDALEDMENLSKKFEDDNANSKYPYQVVLIKENEHGRTEEIFKINKKETVTNFTRILFQEVSNVIVLFEKELEEYGKGFIV